MVRNAGTTRHASNGALNVVLLAAGSVISRWVK
jgi:hypothetical protein